MRFLIPILFIALTCAPASAQPTVNVNPSASEQASYLMSRLGHALFEPYHVKSLGPTVYQIAVQDDGIEIDDIPLIQPRQPFRRYNPPECRTDMGVVHVVDALNMEVKNQLLDQGKIIYFMERGDGLHMWVSRNGIEYCILGAGHVDEN